MTLRFHRSYLSINQEAVVVLSRALRYRERERESDNVVHCYKPLSIGASRP